MQIKSGQAQVLSSNNLRVQFIGMSAADAALLAPGQAFKFQGESLLFFTIASVISSVPATAEVELTSAYNGAVPDDTPTNYLISRDFTPNHALFELSPGDVDIRDLITQSFRIIDALLGGGGGGGLTASGTATVTAGAVTKTVTGTFPAGGTYKVFVTPHWNTTVWVQPASKATGQFILNFGTPAPTGDSAVDWGVV